MSAHFKSVLLVYPNSLHYYTNVTMCAGNLSKVYPRCTLIVYTSRLMCSSAHTWVQTVAMVILWKPVFAHSCAAGLVADMILCASLALGSTEINLVEKLNRLDGTVVLCKPTKGKIMAMYLHSYIIYLRCIESHWGVWTGGRGGVNVALLAAVATGGYHGVSTYQWAGEKRILEEETYPLLYVTERGVFKCTVSTNPGIKVELKFTVSCKYDVVVPFGKGWELYFCKLLVLILALTFHLFTIQASEHVKEWIVNIPPGVAHTFNLTQGSHAWEIESKVLDHAIRRLTKLSQIETCGKCVQAVLQCYVIVVHCRSP